MTHKALPTSWINYNAPAASSLVRRNHNVRRANLLPDGSNLWILSTKKMTAMRHTTTGSLMMKRVNTRLQPPTGDHRVNNGRSLRDARQHSHLSNGRNRVRCDMRTSMMMSCMPTIPT